MADDEAAEANNSTTRKRCFVTIGATAPFNSLIDQIMRPHILEALSREGYTELRIQYGKEGKRMYDLGYWTLEPANISRKYRMEVSGFDFNQSGLRGEMRAAKGHAVDGCEEGLEGMVISHAGSGSILDALRISVPILVVPNPELMDNHQVELAEALEHENYVVHGKLQDLVSGITQIEKLRSKQQKWPPVTSEDRRGRLDKVIKEEMGWLD